MDNIVYGTPRYDDMQSFLDFIYEIVLANPNITDDFKKYQKDVYYFLCRTNLKKDDYDENGKAKDVKHLFEGWSAAFRNSENMISLCDEVRWS